MKLNRKKTIFVLATTFIIALSIFSYLTSNPYRLKRANGYYEKGQYSYALELYNKIDNKDIDTLIKEEKCEMQLKEYREALETLKIIETKTTNNINNFKPSIYYDRVICFYSLGEYDNAINTAKLYYAVSTNLFLDQVIESYVVDSYLKNNRIDDCINEINKYLLKYTDDKFKPHIIELNNILFSLYLSKKNYETALIVNDKLILSQPDNLQFYIGRAALYSEKYNRKYAYNYLVNLRDKFRDNKDLEKFIISYKD